MPLHESNMHMTSHRIAAISLLSTVLLTVPLTALANPTTFMKFETFEVEEEVVSVFYKELKEAIEDHPEMSLEEGGKVTFAELTTTIGCGSEEDCLPELQDFVKARRMVYGSIQHTDNIYLFTIKIYDFESGAPLHPASEITIEGRDEDALKAIPNITESALYGPIGQLTVSGAAGSQVLINGKKVGEIPFESSKLPLGEHIVIVRDANGEEQKRKVHLKRGKVSKLAFEDTSIVEPPPAEPLNLTVPAYVSLGVGALALGYGAFSGVQLLGLNSQADAYAGRTSVSNTELSDIQRIEQENDVAYTGMVVGLSVGVVAAAAGVAMLLLPGTPESAGESAGVEWTLTPTAESVHMGVRWSF